MSFKMQRVHVYYAEVEDKPGGIAAKLKTLAEAGAHLAEIKSVCEKLGATYQLVPIDRPLEIVLAEFLMASQQAKSRTRQQR